MTLENLVPSLEDCERIPAGSFPESALVWVKTHTGKWVVGEAFLSCGIGSRRITALEHYPAPTLTEILAELPYGTTVMLDAPNMWVCINRDKRINITKADNPATAALRLWERVNDNTTDFKNYKEEV